MTEAQTIELLALLRQIAADVARISAQGEAIAKYSFSTDKVLVVDIDGATEYVRVDF